MMQKEVFLQAEGDAWFSRNREAVARRRLPDEDAILRALLAVAPGLPKPARILEIGCGDGTRLAWLKEMRNAQCFGIEPSAQAVAAARTRGVDAQQGTADVLPFEANSFDVVVFGFCLYLCDRDDLFRIASEADRVLRSPGWLLIEDFFSPTPRARPYHHRPGVNTYKMDYRTLFAWHPAYVCVAHEVRNHPCSTYTDDPEAWVAVSVIRKRPSTESP